MKRKLVATAAVVSLMIGLLGGCQKSEAVDKTENGKEEQTVETAQKEDGGTAGEKGNTEYDDLTPEEEEALAEGLIRLDGTLPIITDPQKFEEKYGNISMHFITSADRVTPAEELELVQDWARETGVYFDWTTIPGEGAAEKINLMLSSGDELPDVFWNLGDGKSGNVVCQYEDQDVFYPTNELIDSYMPNLKKVLDDNPNYRAEITAPSGNIYGFPYIEEMLSCVLSPGPMVINKVWLDKLGLEVPETTEEFAECLKAFKEAGDLNENGKDDEVILATRFGSDDTFGSYDIFYRFTGAFGCADSYCGGNAYADHLRLIDDKVTFTAMDKAFYDTAAYFHDLQEEGLIWSGSFEADESAAYYNTLLKGDEAVIGAFGIWDMAQVASEEVRKQYVGVPRLQGPGGYGGFALNYSELQDAADTAITNECRFPHVVAKFVDYLISDPYRSIQANWGKIGYAWQLDENNMMYIPEDEQGNQIVEGFGSYTEARMNTTPCRGSMIVLSGWYNKYIALDIGTIDDYQIVNGKNEILDEYDTIPKVMMTNDELSRLAQIQPTISDIVNRYVTDWVLNGTKEASWESYLAELEGAGVNELVEIYQRTVDRGR